MQSHPSFSEVEKNIDRVLITEDQIKEAVERAAHWVDETYSGKKLLLVGLLTGSFLFLSDLCKRIGIYCEVSFMSVKSYFDGTESNGKPQIELDIKADLSDYHVLIVEDLIDSGNTLLKIKEMLQERNPQSLRILTLLNKISKEWND